MQAQSYGSLSNLSPHSPRREPNCKPDQQAVQKGRGAASSVAIFETSPDSIIVDTHNSGATLVASMGDFLMRSLTSVLIPRQLQGGSGPEPAATHESGTTASQRARLRQIGLIPNKSDRWSLREQVRPLEMWIPTSLRFLLPQRFCASCCRQTVRSALSASTLREQFYVMLRTAHSVRAR